MLRNFVFCLSSLLLGTGGVSGATITANTDPDTGDVIDTPEFLSATITSNPAHVRTSGAPGQPLLALSREQFKTSFIGSSLTNWRIEGDVGTTLLRDTNLSPYYETMTVVIDFTVTHIVPPHAHSHIGDPFRFRYQFSTDDTPTTEVPGAKVYTHDSALFAVPHKTGHSDNYLVDFEADIRLTNGAWSLFEWEIIVKGEHDYIPPIPLPGSGGLILTALGGAAGLRRLLRA